jgi:hypothetical protein
LEVHPVGNVPHDVNEKWQDLVARAADVRGYL